MNFIVNTVLTADFMPFQLEQVMEGNNPDEISAAELARRNPGHRTQFMRRHSQVFLEMVISRLVDNFQRYVSELLREVLRRQPNILKTSEKSLSMDDVLRFERMEDLIADVIERRVSALSYQGFGSIQEWCQGKGIPLTADDVQRVRVVDFIATRNVIAHNRGRVDERYAQAVPDSPFAVGSVRTLLPGDLWVCAFSVTDTVIRTDCAVAEKFGLARSAFLASPVGHGILEGPGGVDSTATKQDSRA
jgi:hypothetical protein